MILFLLKKRIRKQYINLDHVEWEALKQASKKSGKVYRKIIKDQHRLQNKVQFCTEHRKVLAYSKELVTGHPITEK